jgi:hypothetical protein
VSDPPLDVDAFLLRLPHQEVQVSGYAHEFREKLRETDQALSEFLRVRSELDNSDSL